MLIIRNKGIRIKDSKSNNDWGLQHMSKRVVAIYIILIVFVISVTVFIYTYRLKIGKIAGIFLLAVIIAYLLDPIVKKLERKKIPRKIGILLIYAVFSGFIAAIGVFVVPEMVSNMKELMDTLPDIISGYQGMLNDVIATIKTSKWSGEIKDIVYQEIQNTGNIIQAYITNTLRNSLNVLFRTVTILFDLLLAMVIAYYFIKDAEFFKSLVFSLVPSKWRNGIMNISKEINFILSNFIQGQLVTAFIVGILEVIGLVVLKVKYSMILGLFGGITNIIPYFGPFIGAVPAVAVSLLESPKKAILTAIMFIVVQQIDNSFISPKVIEGRLGLHPVTTILAVLIGGEFFGILGMLISVPVIAILRVIFKRIIEWLV